MKGGPFNFVKMNVNWKVGFWMIIFSTWWCDLFDLEMVCFDWLIMGKTAEMLLLYVKFNRIWQHIQTWRPIQEVKNKWVLSWLIWQLHVSYKAPPSFPNIPIRYPRRPWSRIKWIKKTTLFFFMKLELRNAATVNIFFRLLNQWDYWVSL